MSKLLESQPLNKGFEINGQTKILAVIGDPIAHSMSPAMHNAAIRELDINYCYIAFQVKRENLREATNGFKALNIRGINVTIPHKKEILKYLDEIDPTAKKLGAVNTIKNDNGRLIGRNTDGEGALQALEEHGFNIKSKKAVILGAGGAARGLSFYLAQKLDKLTIVKRKASIKEAYDLANDLKKHYDLTIEILPLEDIDKLKVEFKETNLLINSTPVGMHPKTDVSPIPKTILHDKLFVFDIVYNPGKTKLLKDAEEVGAKALGGLEMLVNQGALAFEWWTGKKPNRKIMLNTLKKFLKIE